MVNKGKEKKKSMKYVTTKIFEYYSAIEEPPTIVGKEYLCRVIVCGSYGKFRVYYWALKYNGDGKWIPQTALLHIGQKFQKYMI